MSFYLFSLGYDRLTLSSAEFFTLELFSVEFWVEKYFTQQTNFLFCFCCLKSIALKDVNNESDEYLNNKLPLGHSYWMFLSSC